MKIIRSTSGFTLIELLVGMTIFVVGLTGILGLLHTTMSSSVISRDEIVVSGLLREQIDLIFNTRDTNVSNFLPWDSIYEVGGATTQILSGAYTVENNFVDATINIDPTYGSINSAPVQYVALPTLPTDDATLWSQTRLYLDDQGRYTHAVTSTGTIYASYVILSPLTVVGAIVREDPTDPTSSPQGWVIDARVIVNNNGAYRTFDAKSMITDWVK